MSSTAMMGNGIGCVLVVEAGREWRPMLCADNWDSAAMVYASFACYMSFFTILYQEPIKEEVQRYQLINPTL